MSPEDIKKSETLYKAAREENDLEKSDLYSFTLDMLSRKITFEEWIRKTVLWAKEVTQTDTQGNDERGKEAL